MVGDRIKEHIRMLREEKNRRITQNNIAQVLTQETGKSYRQSDVSKLLSSEANITVKELRTICSYLKIDLITVLSSKYNKYRKKFDKL